MALDETSETVEEESNCSTAVCIAIQVLTSQVGANLVRGHEVALVETGQAYALGHRTEEYHNEECDMTMLGAL